VLLGAQSATAQNGPWILTSLAGSVMSFVRPSYWSGTIFGNTLFYVQQGPTYFGQIATVSGAISTGSSVGVDTFTVYTGVNRGNTATLAANTFTAVQTFVANSPTGSAPFKFLGSGSGLNTTPIAHQVEWDGAILYVTNASSIRNSLFYGSGGTFTGAVALKSLFETAANPNISAGTITLDLSTASYFNVTLSSNITAFNISFGGTPLTSLSSFTLELIQDSTGGRTVAWSFVGKTLKWANGSAPTQTSTAFKSDIYTFVTRDFGASYYGFVRGQNF